MQMKNLLNFKEYMLDTNIVEMYVSWNYKCGSVKFMALFY